MPATPKPMPGSK
ncbi:hypothetical protein SAMN04487940_105193 [Marinovum algicola]|uniref:Uncharacterized protein n=3 Tax=Roseobacteraceae TaxID=2854170 RepID=A0A975ZN75_9RHOB|nr:hypothetical protein SAMN04487940_105193 [Marinovum algicola]